MAEYIEREFAIKQFEEWVGESKYAWEKSVKRKLQQIPAADVRPERHGEWIVDDVESSDGTYAAYIEAHCSQCNFALGFENGEYGWYIGDRIPFDYCPNCGAKMDVKDD